MWAVLLEDKERRRSNVKVGIFHFMFVFVVSCRVAVAGSDLGNAVFCLRN